jgi:hypothetical protein
MEWQELAALGIVGLAAFLLVRPLLLARGHCRTPSGNCSCAGSSSAAPKGSIVFRARKGERPQIIVKMG